MPPGSRKLWHNFSCDTMEIETQRQICIRRGFKIYELTDPLPTSSFRRKRDRNLSRMPRSAPGSAGNISGGRPRLDKISSPAEFRLRSVCRIFLNARAFLLKFRNPFFLVILIEDCGTIARPDVGELAVG